METHAPAAIEELCAAAAAGDLPRLQSALSLLPANPNLNALNRRRLAPLHCAVNAGSEACVRALVCAGADLGAREGDEGKAALSLAAQSGDLRCVTALLELGAVVDVRDNDGWTPLMTAAYFGEEQILAALLAAGADVEAAAACGRLATHLAATASEAGCLAALVRSGASVASRDAGGGTPLHAAAAAGQLPAIRCLLEAGADPGARDGAGRTPAQVAAAAGHATAAEELSKLEPAGQEAAGPAFGSNVHSSAAVSAINAPLPSGAALLGHGVRVWWHERQEWVDGCVVEFFAAAGVHLVEFPDAPARMQLQRMRLEHERVQLAGAAGQSSTAQQQQGLAAALQQLDVKQQPHC